MSLCLLRINTWKQILPAIHRISLHLLYLLSGLKYPYKPFQSAYKQCHQPHKISKQSFGSPGKVSDDMLQAKEQCSCKVSRSWSEISRPKSCLRRVEGHHGPGFCCQVAWMGVMEMAWMLESPWFTATIQATSWLTAMFHDVSWWTHV